ncbi:MAG: methylated-DNA--[protein]-cysteine S-methyltransferase [Candidatus Aminicenantales bacterium]
MSEHRAYFHSPIGAIEIIGTEQGITALNFIRRKPRQETGEHPFLKEAAAQVEEYFRGQRKKFSLKLHLQGTEFQKNVWRELLRIPYGRTASYGEVAAALGRPQAGRAIGQANHRNPIAIVIPCHRIIGGDGRLVGYGAGLWRKQWLLAHEQKSFHETLKRRRRT